MALDYHRVRAAIKAAAQTEAELPEAKADEVAFHMTDWVAELDALYQLCQDPESHSTSQVNEVLTGFLVHAPNHIAAAAKLLTGIGVSDIFEVGAVEETPAGA